ncbi:MAG TPA: O-methyltransferase [Actinomycetota bacterium]|nr:O-methyltransferase [Actinomycetota bacterium]
MNFIETHVAEYLNNTHSGRDVEDDVLEEMEHRAKDLDFPIVGRTVGSFFELIAKTVGATRVFEMGSGYGYSAYWYARAVGEGGKVTLTDGDPANVRMAQANLEAAGLASRCDFRVGDAIESLESTEGQFDIVYCDIDKQDYPRAFLTARDKVRPGGLYICDNVLWSGRVASDQEQDDLTRAIREHNELIVSDPHFASSIVPLRDGVMVALRIR